MNSNEIKYTGNHRSAIARAKKILIAAPQRVPRSRDPIEGPAFWINCEHLAPSKVT